MIAAAAVALGLAPAAPAAAQIGASVAVHSDYRYRGYSLSQDRPAAALNLSYDHRTGLYAGGSVATVDTAEESWRPMGALAYAGYARRGARGPTWDVGVSALKVKYHAFPYRSASNEEIYAGVVGERLSLRLAYAPDYFDLRQKTLYLDLGAAFRPAPGWRVFGHAGLLSRVGGRSAPDGRSERYDLSAGAARRIGPAEILVQVTEAGPGGPRGPDHDGVTVSASWYF